MSRSRRRRSRSSRSFTWPPWRSAWRPIWRSAMPGSWSASYATLVARHPLRERLRGQLMLALYRSRQAGRGAGGLPGVPTTLSEELGLEPGPSLQQLELASPRPRRALDPSRDRRRRPAGPEPEEPAAAVPVRRVGWSGAGRARCDVLALLACDRRGRGVVGRAAAGHRRRDPRVTRSVRSAPLTGAIRAVVPLGTSPSAVAAGDGAVWVANYNAGTVSRLDPALRAVVQTIPVGSTPTGLAVGRRRGVGDRQLWRRGVPHRSQP